MKLCPMCGSPIPRPLPKATTMTPAEITALRQALGETKRAFAAAMGVSRQTVIRWERGVYKAGPQAVRALLSRKQMLTASARTR